MESSAIHIYMYICQDAWKSQESQQHIWNIWRNHEKSYDTWSKHHRYLAKSASREVCFIPDLRNHTLNWFFLLIGQICRIRIGFVKGRNRIHRIYMWLLKKRSKIKILRTWHICLITQMQILWVWFLFLISRMHILQSWSARKKGRSHGWFKDSGVEFVSLDA